MVGWCSWLSRMPHTHKVSGSSPGSIKYPARVTVSFLPGSLKKTGWAMSNSNCMAGTEQARISNHCHLNASIFCYDFPSLSNSSRILASHTPGYSQSHAISSPVLTLRIVIEYLPPLNTG